MSFRFPRNRALGRGLCGPIIILLFLTPVLAAAQQIVQEFPAPGPEARGLAWDGEYLWCADAALDSIYQIDPGTGRTVHAIAFNFLNDFGGGLTWGKGQFLWVTRYTYFHKVDPSTGRLISQFDAPG
jgi:hypothetical protein